MGSTFAVLGFMAKKTSKLHDWMSRRGHDDHWLATILRTSRVQANRIRNRKSGTSPARALKLQALTRIDWHTFIEPKITTQKKRVSA